MREEAVVVIRLDTGELPAKSQQAAQSLQKIGATGEISARQTAAAMRQLPAQLTDVATQLAGGQNPLLILLQQGGQVKDSFGGIGPAIRGIGAAINPVTLGLGAVAAAAGALSAGLVQGMREAQAYDRALILTGNAAGTTSDALADMARRIDGQVGTQREAAAALENFAATALVGANNLEQFATIAVRMERTTGQAVDVTVKQFAELARSPVEASVRLNQQVNYLTRSVYDQIAALVAQGRETDAARVAQEAYANALGPRLEKLEGNLGSLQRAWRGVREFATEAWDSMLGVGRGATLTERIATTEAQIAALDARKSANPQLTQQRRTALAEQLAGLQEVERLTRRSANAQGEASAREQAAITAREEARKRSGKKDGSPGKPYIPGEFQVLDARDGAILAAAREKAESEREAFFQSQLQKQYERDAKRLTGDANFLQEILDGNTRAGLQLIEDEQTRGEALIALDLQIAQRRLQAQGIEGGARDEATRLLDERALVQRRELEQQLRRSNDKIADEAGKETYDDVKGALSAAFRDTSNPAKAFAAALGTAVFQRVTAGLADALATAAVGANGKGGLLGQALDFLGSLNGGYSVDTGGIGTNNTGASLPTRGGLATGTNYVPRTMIVKVHEGEAIVPKRYNPAAGGGGGNGQAINITQNVSVPPGMSPAAFRHMLEQHGRDLKSALLADAARPGRGLNTAIASGLA